MDLNKLIAFSKKLSVLYLEDDKDAADATLDLFKNFFDDIDWAENGKIGLECFEKKRYDIIFVDLHMPVMNGVEFCRQALDTNTMSHIIIISAYNDSEHYFQALQLGVHGYLGKPISLENFKTSVYRVIEKIYYLHEYKKHQRYLETKLEQTSQKADKQRLELKYTNFHDELTSITNRAKLENDLLVLDESDFLLVDIDGFSHINGIYGSKVGDLLLIEFAKILEEFAISSFYTVYRVGGDHFALLRYGKKTIKAQKLAKQLIEYFTENSVTLHDVNSFFELNFSITIGIAQNYAGHKLMENAIEALKYAQNNAKSMTVYSDKLGIERKYKRAFDAVNTVKHALQEDNLVPFFQPIYKGRSGYAYECLARVQNNDTVLTPDMFITDIFHTSLYAKMTRTIIEKSFVFFARKNIDFSINLSYKDIDNPKLVQTLKTQIQQYGVAHNLILEIVESEYLHSFDLVHGFMHDMKKMGVRFAIDDFGSGYSNFTYLLKLRPDFLKIDGSLIKSIDKDNDSYSIVKAINSFAKDLHIQTIAEYIHSKDVYKTAKKLNIDAFQGYYIGKPKPKIKI